MSAVIIHIPTVSNKLVAKHGCSFDRRAKVPAAYVAVSSTATFRCNAATQTTSRRSANYKPPLWDFDFVQSLSSEYAEDKYSTRATEMVAQVRMRLQEEMGVVEQLELIDDLERLGISYHFQDEIHQILRRIHSNLGYSCRDLYSTALGFRLLRQHGFKVPQEVFDCFKNEDGGSGFNGDSTEGLLQLYEASFLLTRGEKTLELAREFSADLLQKKLEADRLLDDDDDDRAVYLSLLARSALELPTHWRIQRPNARWFIDVYAKSPRMSPLVHDLAKLDFNIVQATHQQELKHVSRWWKQTGLAEKLPFARDRLVECYFWTTGGLFEPEYGYSRIMATKVNVFIMIMDDIFDVYGTLEELLLFNNTIQRWDIESISGLPNYMQMCFLALNNFVDEMAYNVLKEQGVFIIPHLRKSWADLCAAFTREAEWYWRGQMPTLEEYIKNAWISVSAPVILSHAFFLITNPIQEEVVRRLYEYHNLVRCSAMLFRLANDLGTSQHEMERGDVPKSVECCMNESGASREEAREHVEFMIGETWKGMNEEGRVSDPPFSRDFVRSAVGLGRMAQYMYQHGDGLGIQNPQIMHRISALLFQPIA